MTFVRAHIYLYFICCRFFFFFFSCIFFGIRIRSNTHEYIFRTKVHIISRQRPFIHVIPKSYTSHLFRIILNGPCGLCAEKNLCVYVFLRRFFSCYCYCLLLSISPEPSLIVVHLVCIAISQKACNNNTEKNESHFKFSTNVSLYLKWAFGAFFHQNLLLGT